jgi:hypothetical protein
MKLEKDIKKVLLKLKSRVSRSLKKPSALERQIMESKAHYQMLHG